MSGDPAVRFVACLEAAKGLVVLAAGCGLLSLLHRDIHAFAVGLIQHAHLDPAARYPKIFLDAAAGFNDGRLLLLAAGAAVYAGVRFVEAYGLFREKSWAELLAALSGAVYVPFELLDLVREPSWHGAALLALNLAIVAIMVRAMRKRRALMA